MGKQINYYMDKDSFLKIAEVALNEGCTIVSRENSKEKQIPKADISVITDDYDHYYFFLPQSNEYTHGMNIYGEYYIEPSRLAVIEAGYSVKAVTEDGNIIMRNRLYIPTGLYDDNGIWIPRSEELERIYNKLARLAQKLCPPRAVVHEGHLRYNGAFCKHNSKEYISEECQRWRENGYELDHICEAFIR